MSQTILIVDDSASIRRSIRTCIEQNPEWQICGEAENGWEGIEKAQELHPDLIVLDLSMPGMTGIEALRTLKQLMPAIPVIVFSEYVTVFSEAEARSEGVTALVSKTEPISTLLGKVRALLNRGCLPH